MNQTTLSTPAAAPQPQAASRLTFHEQIVHDRRAPGPQVGAVAHRIAGLSEAHQLRLVGDLLTLSPAIIFASRRILGGGADLFWESEHLGEFTLPATPWSADEERRLMATHLVLQLISLPQSRPSALHALRHHIDRCPLTPGATSASGQPLGSDQTLVETLMEQLQLQMIGPEAREQDQNPGDLLSTDDLVACTLYRDSQNWEEVASDFTLIVAMPGEVLAWHADVQMGERHTTPAARRLLPSLQAEEAQRVHNVREHLKLTGTLSGLIACRDAQLEARIAETQRALDESRRIVALRPSQLR